jgi:hypothetical protein
LHDQLGTARDLARITRIRPTSSCRSVRQGAINVGCLRAIRIRNVPHYARIHWVIRPVIDKVLHECAISVIVAPTLAVLLAQAGNIGGLVPTIIVVVVREVIGVCVEGPVEPEAGEKCESSYG